MRYLFRALSAITPLIVTPQSRCCLRAVTAFKLTLPRSSRRRSLHALTGSYRSRYSYASSTSLAASPEDFSRWERMYNEEGQSPGDKDDSSDIVVDLLNRSEVRVISFDLDNTLWKTSPVIGGANDALAEFLDSQSIQQPERVETIMGELFRADMTHYAPLDPNPTSPVKLTQLRVDALSYLLEEHNDFTNEEAEALSMRAFEVWTNARHALIPENMVESSQETLDKLRTLKTSQGHPVTIMAITDGNSDPRKVKQLSKYFDHVVNAEQVGVGKPDKRVYMKAIKFISSLPDFQDIFADAKTDDEIENLVGPFWVHIGDDFVKDVVAAKGLRMRTIWTTELLPKAKKEDIIEKVSSDGEDLKKFVEKVSDKAVVKMAIGSEDYLADAVTQEFADSICEKFEAIAPAIVDWHEDGLKDASVGTSTTPDVNEESFPANQVEVEPPVSKPNEKVKVVKTLEEEGILTITRPGDKKAPPVDQQAPPRAFRLIRDDCSMDIPAPRNQNDQRTMKELLQLAQLDKASGVFAFPEKEVQSLKDGKMTLMIGVGGTDLSFSREIFGDLTTTEVLDLSEQEPLEISLFMKKASQEQSFELF